MTYRMFINRFTLIMLLAGTLVVTSGGAQETLAVESRSTRSTDDINEAGAANNPLKRADTSSPRDTLRSFLTDSKIAAEAYLGNGGVLALAGWRAKEEGNIINHA